MSVLTLAGARAQVSTGLSDDDLQAVIDREEEYLEGELGAPIAGERTQEIWLARDRARPDDLYLARPTDALDGVTDNGVTLDPADVRLLANGTIAERADGAWVGPRVTLTYTPKDALSVARVIVELVRLTLGETGFNSEDIGDYKYQRSGIMPASAMQIQAASRKALVRQLILPRPRPASVPLHAFRTERIGA